MQSADIINLYTSHPNAGVFFEHLNEPGKHRFHLPGLSGSSKAYFIAAIYNKLKVTQLIILNDKEEAAYFHNDLVSILGKENIFFFPSSYKRSIQFGQMEPGSIVLRTEVINHLGSGKRKCIIVSYPESVMEKVISKKNLQKNTLNIKKGDALSMEFIEEMLIEYNFERVDFVSEPGQFSLRGSILDIFSYSGDMPFRLDFSGDEIESIRTFNPEDQLSVEKMDIISVIPNIQDISIEEAVETLPEFLSPSSMIWMDDKDFIIDRIDRIFDSEWTYEAEGLAPDKNKLAVTGAMLSEEINKFDLADLSMNISLSVTSQLKFNTSPQPEFSKNFEILGDRLIRNRDEGIENIIVSENKIQIQRLKDIFSEIRPGLEFNSLPLNLHRGFVDNDLKICIFTDHQIFERYHKFRVKPSFSRKESLSMKELTSLNPGDYVVHTDHGIGKFGGLEKVEINGKIQENIKLVYKDNDTLYVGIHALHRISKYKGREGAEPRIYKLGTGAWDKLKSRTKKKIKDIARNLIILYAKRREVPGYGFSPDSYMQRELEASFIYEDTPDQLAATMAVKKDMEESYPMDRLICGDVGFGKTEIAVRAAFKAAADSKQTAILVPTTILALQHYQTFMSRLENFPVNIEYISRHKKASEQKEIIRNLKSGELDIIIGTHRLVGKDIVFKNLGLLIIDEEQRFGVAVKEKLKEMRTNVDTLTLTATPIPRTLQFSLMGARDLSIINTPPPNRMPIITELHGFNEEIIKEGIEYEISRNGQVFFIHNRVDNIREVEQAVIRIVPGIKTAIVHGQMEGRIVENIMFDFVHGDYDVLIATTIIESGLDIPNANTIFINNAHHFGLSELHQLRGRVGRSNKKAFCYLLAPPLNLITQEAKRRLKAIEEFSELGSGFNIAMQDLDIRGSGNLLGSEQSGFIADVGFETYQRILDEAMQELKAEAWLAKGKDNIETEEDVKTSSDLYINDCLIETDLEIMFPDEYISNISERIRLYKELNSISSDEELLSFENRLADRFGKLPPPATELLNMVKLRRLACRLAVEKLVLKNETMVMYFTSDPESTFYKSNTFMSVIRSVSSDQKKYRVKHNGNKLVITAGDVSNIYQAIGIFSHMLNYKTED